VLFVGQWAPIVGTGFAALGSLYLLLAVDLDAVRKKPNSNTYMHHCRCSTHDVGVGRLTASSDSIATSRATDVRRSFSDGGEGIPNETTPTTSQPSQEQANQSKRSWTTDMGNRRKVAQALTAIDKYLGTAAQAQFDDSEFKHGKALDFPEIPGEEHRNSALPQIREQYNQYRDARGNVTPSLREQPSRSGSVNSRLGVEDGSTTPRAASPSPTTPLRPQASVLPAEPALFELQTPPSSSSVDPTGDRLQQRDTLEVPSPVHHSPTRNNTSASTIIPIVTIPGG
jgi:hypothetical protein